MTAFANKLQPLDRIAIAVMLVLSILISTLVLSGKPTAPRVRSFTWENKTVGAEDIAFLLTFSHPMDRQSVENNLRIEPPIPGKFSWAGLRMAYTLIEPPAYGTEFEIRLEGAKDRFFQKTGNDQRIQPFVSHFQSRDRALVYIGVEGKEAGRLILYNLTRLEKKILTPSNLVVTDFQTYPDRDRILFSASESNSKEENPFVSQKLYTVTTGMVSESGNKTSRQTSSTSGIIELVLDDRDYQNLKFDLSADGQTIVVQRVSHKKLANLGLWAIRQGENPQLLGSQPGGDFTITPDSQAIAINQGQGVAILPINPEEKSADNAVKPLDFLPKFGQVLAFSPNGRAAAMVKFNNDYTRSLFVVTDSAETELLNIKGSIISCEFNPSKTNLYCLLSELIPGEIYQELPYLAAINLATGEQTPILAFPHQRDIQIDLSPDGLALLFDQAIVETSASASKTIGPRNQEGLTVNTSRLWLLLLADIATADGISIGDRAVELPLKGFRPQWLP